MAWAEGGWRVMMVIWKGALMSCAYQCVPPRLYLSSVSVSVGGNASVRDDGASDGDDDVRGSYRENGNAHVRF